MPDELKTTEEWLAGMTWDSRSNHEGLTFRKVAAHPEIRIEATWPRGASRQTIATALRDLAAKLEAHDG